MNELKEKNKIVKEQRQKEDEILRDFFDKYREEGYVHFVYDDFRYADSLKDYNEPNEHRKLIKKVAESNLYDYDFFDLANKLKKVAKELEKMGYFDVVVNFESDWDDSSIVMYIKRKETSEEVDARLEKSKQNKKNAKAKKDKELEKLKILAAKKGLKLVKE